MVFRDFIYLDMERIQSIISQIQEGLLTDIMSGKINEVSGSAKFGFLQQLIKADIGGKRSSTTNKSKILHDYSYNIAIQSLQENDLLLDVNDFDRDEFPIPESAFILVKGNAKILDYQTIMHLADNEKKIDKIFKSKPQGNRQERRNNNQSNKNAFSEMKDFIETFIGDGVQVSVTNKVGLSFIGNIDREYLREEIKNLIFKYGSKPQGDWVMLAQVSRIPQPNSLFEQADSFSDLFGNVNFSQISAVSDFFNIFIDALNNLQEMMSSVTYPNISVTPIALYREVESMK
jgi:hypothetical protein